jgi:hypothetical protein
MSKSQVLGSDILKDFFILDNHLMFVVFVFDII